MVACIHRERLAGLNRTLGDRHKSTIQSSYQDIDKHMTQIDENVTLSPRKKA